MKFNSAARFSLSASMFCLAAAAISSPAQVITLAATGISSNNGAATLHASVNPGGSSTGVMFEWGPTTAYGATTPPVNIGAGNSAVAVSAVITGLASLTNYHFRAVATNAAGTNDGNDLAFSTPFYPGGLSAPIITNGNFEVTLNGTTNAVYGLYASTNLVNWSLLPPGQFTFLSSRPFQVVIGPATNVGHWFYLMR